MFFFSKRQYTGKDLIDDGYGRLYELPRLISQAGDNVTGICVSYKKKNQGLILHKHNAKWFSFNNNYLLDGIFHFFKDVIPLFRSIKPDVLVGCSDSLNIIVAYALSKISKKPLVIDLYDNFDSFVLTRIPIIRFLYHHAIIHADAVICVSQPLLEHIRGFSPKGKLFLLENAINKGHFFSVDKKNAREKLGLPEEPIFIGTLGALDNTRNIQVLYKAYEKIKQENTNIHLVLVGRLEGEMPKIDDVHYLGDLDYEDIVYFLNALDVAVICLKDSLFCRYCFPQKFYEILSCRVPLVSANIGVMRSILSDYPALLFNSEGDLCKKILAQINKKSIPSIKVQTWDIQAKRFKNVLLDVCNQQGV